MSPQEVSSDLRASTRRSSKRQPTSTSTYGNPSPGFTVSYPTHRDDLLKNPESWLEGKRADDGLAADGASHLWRVHDKLYDLSTFIDVHPGGKFWLETTRGTDITESFESSHMNPSVNKTLAKYYVRDTTRPRNSPYTFKEDGFYRTLKKKAWPIISHIGTGPTRRMLVMQDGTVAAFLAVMVAAAYYQSYWLAAAAGVLLFMVIGMAHNFFHQADNFRMKYFDLSPLSSADWRISHAISHHLYTNTLYDFEITVLEPFLMLLPDPKKKWIAKTLTLGTFHLSFFLAFFIELLKRTLGVALGKRTFRRENLLPLMELAIMVAVAGNLYKGLRLWALMVSVASFTFAYVGLIAAHHHPDIYHAYDAFRSNPDWGLCQMDAVRDKVETTGSLLLVAVTFGDHTMHHMFPTVDHSKLPLLYPVFLDTCRQFDQQFTFVRRTTLWRGLYMQMASSTPNPRPPGFGNGPVLMAPSVLKEVEKQKK